MIKISACVIVKNEEKNLPRWLRCAKALADETVIVDTGSSDGTTEIAESAGARLYDFKWRDDFSAAKNFAIERAKGSWIVFLDADEYFSEDDIPKVKEHICRADRDRNIMGLICPWVNIDLDRGGAFISESVQLRVFRRHPDIRYSGAIHEMLKTRGKKWRTESLKDVRIWHTGYSTSVVRGKAERNFSILMGERKKRGPMPSDAFYLADCCYALGRYEESLKWAREAVSSGLTLGGRERKPYDVLVNSALSAGLSAQDVRKEAENALKKFPKTADYKAAEGAAYFREKDFLRAEEAFLEALSFSAKGAGHIRAFILGHLADIARRRGKVSDAIDMASEALGEERFYSPALSILGKTLRELSPADVIQYLNTIYDPTADGEFIVNALAKEGLYEVCLYYDKKTGGKVLSGRERLFFAGAYRASAKAEKDAATRIAALLSLASRRLGVEETYFSGGELPDGAKERISHLERVCPWEE